MKNNKINIPAILIALVLGFALGYFIFQSTASKTSANPAAGTSTAAAAEEIWTCSMHPQIRQNEFGLCPICEMDLIPLESNSSSDPLVLKMTEEAVKLANIQTSIIGDQKTNSDKSILLSGKVKADERSASSQVTHLSGRIEKLFVTFTGEKVNKGQQIAIIYSPDLIAAQRELIEADNLKDVNPGLLEAAKNKLRYWKLGETFIKSILENKSIQETFTLYSDASGIVTNRKVAVGDYVTRGEVLFDLISLNQVWVLFDAYEEDLASISLNDKISFTTPSVPGKVFQSRISFIDPVINPQTRVASLRAVVNNSSGKLKPEMFVNGTLQVKSAASSVLSIPKTAVMWTGDRSVVYVKIPDEEIPSFEFREITIGERLGNNYIVLDGLETGEEVVTYGAFTIDAAAQLNNQASMINRKVSLKKEETIKIPDFRDKTPKQFKAQLTNLVSEYFALKDAFVATNPQQADQRASSFNNALKDVDMALVKDEAHEYWMEQLEILDAHSSKILDEEDIEKKRKQFGFVSEAMIAAIEAFGTTSKHVYVQFCPMAFDNTGANWLAMEEQIQNPYFGDKMMKCGLVKRNLAELNN